MKSKGSTDKQIMARQEVLLEIMEEFKSADKNPTVPEIQKKLRTRKIKSVSDITIRRDLAEISAESVFITNLADKTYSQMIEDSFEIFNYVERKAKEIYDDTWSRSKTVTTTDGDGNETIKEEITEEMAEPKIKALYILKGVARDRIQLLSGDVIKTSAALWVQRTKQLEKENQDLKNRK